MKAAVFLLTMGAVAGDWIPPVTGGGGDCDPYTKPGPTGIDTNLTATLTPVGPTAIDTNLCEAM